jgi:hypothetical protein
MFIPMILSFIAGIMLIVFSAKSIKSQGANLFGVFGCIIGLTMVGIAVYLGLPQ